MSDDNRVVSLRLPATTNWDFLELLFPGQASQVSVTSFRRDPSDPHGAREDWSAWPAGDVLDNPHFDEGNTYFCPSLLLSGRDRSIENFRSFHVIVIDDVPTKIKLAEVVALLRISPTYFLETSPGNHQAGWKIEAETSLAWVKGMLSQLDVKLGGKADNLTNPVAWRRLPVGWNTKKAWVDRLGSQGFRVRLKRDYPGPMIRGLDWPADIEDQIGVIVPLTTLDRGIGNAQRPSAAVLGRDPIYRALEAAGHILGEKITSDKHWAATIKCPWIAGHGPTRPLTGAEYVPAIPGQRGWFHCFHCERRGQGEFREQLDTVLRDEGARIVAAFEFDEVDPETVARAYPHPLSGEAIDLWCRLASPPWPGAVGPAFLEDKLADLASRDGMDLGALGAVMMTAASGASDKRALLTPYADTLWDVRPVLWTMLVAETGLRKTALLRHPLEPLRRGNLERMKQHVRDMGQWQALPKLARQQQPAPMVRALLAEDTTIEKLQEWMAANSRGLLYLRDELAGLFEFGRYSGGGHGAAARAFFLETYEGGPATVGRMTRTTTIDNCALAMLGGIQPQKLASFTGLDEDGLLSRFGIVLQQPVTREVARQAGAPDVSVILATIERLMAVGAFDRYRTDDAGEEMIRETERASGDLLLRPDISVGFRGFIRKLHGVHARTALILHLIDGGQEMVIPEDTVARAARYAQFLLGHAAVFYAGLPGSADHTAQAVGSFLLRHPMPRITAGQLRRDIAACRQLRSLREIQDAVFLLVIGGWLQPETNYPSNYAWRVRPGLENQFAARRASETVRAELVKQAMNRLGQYR